MELSESSLNRWTAAVLAGWGPRLAATTALVHPTVTKWRPVPDLTSVGRSYAADHHTLEETLDCLRLLGDIANRVVRRRLRERSSLIAVATGWADATLDREWLRSRLAPIDMLRIRLRQHFQLSVGLRIDPAEHAALVVIDAGTTTTIDDLEMIAAHTPCVFAGGETVAGGANGVVVAFVPRSTSLIADTGTLAQRLRADPCLHGRTVHVWIEPLGRSIEFIDAHLLDLAG